ncbi:MAG: hypothetical protein ACK55I_12545, partial [bacterium]
IGLVVLVEQVLAHAEEPPAAHEVEPGQDQVLGGGEFELPLLDDPLLLAELRRPRERLHERLLPIERDAGGGGLVGRADEPAVAGRDAHHVAQAVLAAVDVGEGVLHLAA